MLVFFEFFCRRELLHPVTVYRLTRSWSIEQIILSCYSHFSLWYVFFIIVLQLLILIARMVAFFVCRVKKSLLFALRLQVSLFMLLKEELEGELIEYLVLNDCTDV